MDIPVLTNFLRGLRLFWESRRLRWLTFVLVLGVLIMQIIGRGGLWLVEQNPATEPLVLVVAVIGGGIWPIFFMITMFLSLIGLQRLVADEESYARSAALLIPWLLISFVALVFLALFAVFVIQTMIFGVAFIGWIGFQAYFSTRTSLRYAASVHVSEVSTLTKVLVAVTNVLCYVVVVGAFIYAAILQRAMAGDTPLFVEAPGVFGLMLVGLLLVIVFNLFNGVVMAAHKDRPAVVNLALLGLFISLYSAYFIYNAGQGASAGIDWIGISVSLFFLLYTMSSIGTTLAGPADTEESPRISKELAAAFTYFLASGYYFADSMFPILFRNSTLGGSLPDLIKLFIFPFIAMVMEGIYVVYLRRAAEREGAVPEGVVPGEEQPLPEGPDETPPAAGLPPDATPEAQEPPEGGLDHDEGGGPSGGAPDFPDSDDEGQGPGAADDDWE